MRKLQKGRDKRLIDLLSNVLYEIERYNISIEKAFVKTCSLKRCSKDSEERERLFQLTKEFIKNVIRLRCIYGDIGRKNLARIFLEGTWRDESSIEPWCIYSVPKWFYERLRELLGEEAHDLFRSIDKRVIWLRINILKASEEKIVRSLEEDGVILERDKDLWYLYKVIDSRKPLREIKAVKDFMAIPQDKASCLVVEALRPERNDKILDMSAAPGIKTSLTAMLTEDQAKIYALDISKKRLYIMKELLKKFGVKSSVDITLADGRYVPAREKIFDKTLIDAPCSSSGAIWKDPSIRLSLLKKNKIDYYSNIQKDLVREAIKMSRIIVYATCSLLPEEGELIVRSFKDQVVFERPLKKFSTGYSKYDPKGLFNRTFPHKDESEGFFISKMIVI